MADLLPWPDWLAGKDADERIRLILQAVLRCERECQPQSQEWSVADPHCEAALPHMSQSVAEQFLKQIAAEPTIVTTGLMTSAANSQRPVIVGTQTKMRLHMAEDWTVGGHRKPRDPLIRDCGHTAERAMIGVRRVGWLDQDGRVWTETPPMAFFEGGSLTPLLIPCEC